MSLLVSYLWEVQGAWSEQSEHALRSSASGREDCEFDKGSPIGGGIRRLRNLVGKFDEGGRVASFCYLQGHYRSLKLLKDHVNASPLIVDQRSRSELFQARPE